MKNFKKAFRLISLVLWLTLAATGLGMASIFTTKEKYQDKEIRIELVEKKQDESEEETDDSIVPD